MKSPETLVTERVIRLGTNIVDQQRYRLSEGDTNVDVDFLGAHVALIQFVKCRFLTGF